MVQRTACSAETPHETWGRQASAEELRCDVCQVLIRKDRRDAYMECGLCESCDIYLNPYPRQPRQDDPRSPGGLVC